MSNLLYIRVNLFSDFGHPFLLEWTKKHPPSLVSQKEAVSVTDPTLFNQLMPD
jgi:hypothetical protein